MTVKLAPVQRLQYFAADGLTPAAGGKIFTYLAGTTTKATTYTTSAGTVANSNPIILNSAGRAPYGVWLTAVVKYKFLQSPATDTDPPASPIFTEDNISGTNDTGETSQWQTSLVVPTYQSSQNFTLVGDQTVNFHIGRRIRLSQTSGYNYVTITDSVYTALTTVTVDRDGDVNIDSGLNSAELSISTSVSHAIPLFPANRKPASFATAYGSGAQTFSVAPMVLDFRSEVAASVVNKSYLSGNLTITIPSGATLGAFNGKKFRVIIGALDNAGTAELFVMNAEYGNYLDESGTISTTSISDASDSNNVPYSTTVRGPVAFRILGYADFTLATAGTWNSLHSLINSVFFAAQIVKPAGFSAYGPGQSIAATTLTQVSLTAELYDIDTTFASSAYTCKTPGTYIIAAGVGFFSSANDTHTSLVIKKDGAQLRAATGYVLIGKVSNTNLSAVVRLVPGEVLDLWVTLSAAQTIYSGDNSTYFTVQRIG